MEDEENHSLEDSMQRFRNEAAEVRRLFAFQAQAESSSAQVRSFLSFYMTKFLLFLRYAVFQRVLELDRIDAEDIEQEAILQATLAKHRGLLEEVLGERSQRESYFLSQELGNASNSACSLNANSDSEGGIVACVTPSQATELNEEEAFERMLLFSGSRSGRLPTNLPRRTKAVSPRTHCLLHLCPLALRVVSQHTLVRIQTMPVHDRYKYHHQKPKLQCTLGRSKER
jgi:hypothetical protein